MALKRPGFSLIVVLTLALGIGATAAVFSLIQGVLLTPPPYQDPAQIVLVSSTRTDGDLTLRPRDWAAAQWMEWRDEAESFDAVAAYRWTFNFWVSDDGSESLEGMGVTQDYFRVAGLEPVIGRAFHETDTGEGATPVVILGYDLWHRRFDGDPAVLGQTLRMSRVDTPPTIIGVMPPGLRFLPSPATAQEPNYDIDALVDFWLPIAPPPEIVNRPIWNVAGRLRDGATLESAQAELEVLVNRQARAEPAFEGTVPLLEPLTVFMNRDGRRILLPLFGAAGLVLLIACGNAAALLLVRGLQRQQEYGVRAAVGAGRVALFRQVTVESLLLALVGGGFGVALAIGIVELFTAIGGHAVPRLDAVTTGWPVLVVGLGSAVLAALLAGLFPALRASGLDPVHALKNAGPKSSAGRGERRLLGGVIMAQTALTLTLLVGAGLLMRTMYNLSGVPSGYDTSRILTMSVTAVQGEWRDFHERALEEVSALPGVEHAAFAWGVPLTGNNWPRAVEIEGDTSARDPGDPLILPARSVTPGYFELLGLDMVRGRDIRSADTGGETGVAVINEAFVERYFPDTDPLGKRIWTRGRERPASQVVGVVENARTDDLTQAAEPEIYLSLWQNGAFSKHLVIRTEADPRALIGTIRQELRAVDPTVAVENMMTLDEIRGDSQASRGFAMQLLVGFALVASVLTLGGIYGVLSLSVVSRRREIAIRTAVGADRRSVLGLIVGEGSRLVAAGVVVGLVAAMALSQVLESFLFEIAPTDPLTLTAAAVLFATVALVACWVPARRATQIDPLDALREG
jgi:putative ABC transport system permease protein